MLFCMSVCAHLHPKLLNGLSCNFHFWKDLNLHKNKTLFYLNRMSEIKMLSFIDFWNLLFHYLRTTRPANLSLNMYVSFGFWVLAMKGFYKIQLLKGKRGRLIYV